MISQAGSDQVMNTIKGFAGNGMIGYVEYSYPINADYPVVKVLNKAGYFVEPTQYNTAVALTKAKINQDKNSQLYLTQILDGVYTNPDPRAYPISSYSYMIIPTGCRRPADDDREAADARGLHVLLAVRRARRRPGRTATRRCRSTSCRPGFDQIAKLKKADSAVDLTDRDVTSCNNPTFDGKNLNKNVLAEIAPQPAACDKVGAGPCGTETGTNTPNTPDGGGGGDGTGGGTGGGAGTPVAAADRRRWRRRGRRRRCARRDRPGDRLPVGGDRRRRPPPPATRSTRTPPSWSPTARSDERTFGWLAVLELLALVLVPGLLRRRHATPPAGQGRGPAVKRRSAAARRPRPAGALAGAAGRAPGWPPGDRSAATPSRARAGAAAGRPAASDDGWSETKDAHPGVRPVRRHRRHVQQPVPVRRTR